MLQDASINWVRDEHENQWTIRDRANEIIGYLPAGLDEKTAMGILRQMRSFELTAFEMGEDIGRRDEKDHANHMRVEYEARLTDARMENERLAEKLHQFIDREE